MQRLHGPFYKISIVPISHCKEDRWSWPALHWFLLTALGGRLHGAGILPYRMPTTTEYIMEEILC